MGIIPLDSKNSSLLKWVSIRAPCCCWVMAGVLRGTSTALFKLIRKPAVTVYRLRSSMAGYLIDEPKYAWLKELGLSSQNPGVFDGTWHGAGEVRQSLQLFFNTCTAVDNLDNEFDTLSEVIDHCVNERKRYSDKSDLD